MIRRSLRLLSLFALVMIMVSAFPLGVAAQFPSQGQGGPSGGGFPSGGTAGRGGVYQGQAFAFSLSWGPEWTLVGEAAEEGFESVALTNGISLVTVGGFTLQDTPQDAVMNTAETLGNGEWLFAEVIFDEPDRAAAYFDAPQEGNGYLIDIIGIDGSSALFIIWRFPSAQYDAEWERFLALMEGFE